MTSSIFSTLTCLWCNVTDFEGQIAHYAPWQILPGSISSEEVSSFAALLCSQQELFATNIVVRDFFIQVSEMLTSCKDTEPLNLSYCVELPSRELLFLARIRKDVLLTTSGTWVLGARWIFEYAEIGKKKYVSPLPQNLRLYRRVQP